MDYNFNNKNKAGYSLGHYLLSIELIIAGYPMTLDEIQEMYSHKKRVNSEFDFFTTFTISKEKYEIWKKIAIQEIIKKMRIGKKRAEREFYWLDFQYGLSVKE